MARLIWDPLNPPCQRAKDSGIHRYYRYPGAVLSTFPSIYQTLPRDWQNSVVDLEGQPVSIFDPKNWKENEWGFFNSAESEILSFMLPNISDANEREKIAFAYLQSNLKRAELFSQALDRKANPPEGLEIYLFAGDNTNTYSKIRTIPVANRTKNKVFEVVESLPGDDTVTRASAIADLRVENNWTGTVKSPIDFEGVYFLFSDHFGITHNPVFIDNILYLLLEKNR